MPPATRTGLDRPLVLPSPSLPAKFSPQQYAAPAVVSPHVCSNPALTEAKVSPVAPGGDVGPLSPPQPMTPASAASVSSARRRCPCLMVPSAGEDSAACGGGPPRVRVTTPPGRPFAGAQRGPARAPQTLPPEPYRPRGPVPGRRDTPCPRQRIHRAP